MAIFQNPKLASGLTAPDDGAEVLLLLAAVVDDLAASLVVDVTVVADDEASAVVEETMVLVPPADDDAVADVETMTLLTSVFKANDEVSVKIEVRSAVGTLLSALAFEMALLA